MNTASCVHSQRKLSLFCVKKVYLAAPPSVLYEGDYMGRLDYVLQSTVPSTYIYCIHARKCAESFQPDQDKNGGWVKYQGIIYIEFT